jgi:hypothetical protein
LIAICHSIHPSSLSRLPSTCVNWREAASIEESLECFDYGTHTVVFSLLHGCISGFYQCWAVLWIIKSESRSLTASAPENLSSFSWGVPKSEDRRFLLLRCSRIRGPPVPSLEGKNSESKNSRFWLFQNLKEPVVLWSVLLYLTFWAVVLYQHWFFCALWEYIEVSGCVPSW